jgi:predicted phage tail protein
MLRKVKLYGELADFVGHKELDAVINCTADAIRFLITNFEGLEAHMADRYYKVLVDDYEIGEEDIHNPIGQSDISIVPVISGAGGGVGRTLLGIALVGTALLMPGGGFLAFKEGTQTFLAGLTMNVGVGLTLMGVTEMLFPLPKPKDFSDEEDPRISFSFSGVQNTSRAGTSHPIVYGEIITGSVVISAGIDTNQVSA